MIFCTSLLKFQPWWEDRLSSRGSGRAWSEALLLCSRVRQLLSRWSGAILLLSLVQLIPSQGLLLLKMPFLILISGLGLFPGASNTDPHPTGLSKRELISSQNRTDQDLQQCL